MIFDIQNYCLYDGPGIRTSVFFKGCPLHCRWCHNPESIRREPQMSYRPEKCTACGRCVSVCTQDAVKLEGGRIHRSSDRCLSCGRCAEACPNEAVECIGYPISASELVVKLAADIPFFEESGGGVTLTGGEPTLQPEFLFELLDLLRRRGIHTAIETCGLFHESLTDQLSDAVDLFLFDLKQMDTEKHSNGTGSGNQNILRNFSILLNKIGSDRVIPRIPVIPGFNSDADSTASLIAFLKSSRYQGPVHLMPYHEWSSAKYQRIGLKGPVSSMMEESDRMRIINQFDKGGFTALWGG